MAESYPNGKKTLWEKEKLLVTSNFSFFHSVFKRLVSRGCQKVSLCGNGLIFDLISDLKPQLLKPYSCGVHSREVQRRPRNHEVPSLCVNFGIFIDPHIWREYWCSSQEAESIEIGISCKNLFLYQGKINMFKLNHILDNNYNI